MGYYDGCKLLSMRDLNNKKPEIYISTSNRNAGKTTFFNRLCLNKFIQKKEKFCILYRYNYEIDDCAGKFFSCISDLFFKNHEMSYKMASKNVYAELFFDGKSCGYATSLNMYEQIKKCSHKMSDVKRILFDEFQSEKNRYLSNEMVAFLSIHTSLARGGGEQVKYLPVYMISNTVSIANPYFLSMGITDRLRNNTNYLKGNGFVLEQGFYQEVANMQIASGFNQAFSSEKYVAYAAQNVYLNDNEAFVQKPSGSNRYICTIAYNNKKYSIRSYFDSGVYYMSRKIDNDNTNKISFSTNSHEDNFILANVSSPYARMLKNIFECGKIRFENQECKTVFLDMLRYNI